MEVPLDIFLGVSANCRIQAQEFSQFAAVAVDIFPRLLSNFSADQKCDKRNWTNGKLFFSSECYRKGLQLFSFFLLKF